MSNLIIVVADDHQLIRQGLATLLESQLPVQKVFQASDGTRALELIKANNPAIAILDISMPELGGLEVLAQLQTLHVQTRAIMLTMHHDDSFFESAMDSGAMGYLLKEDASQLVVDCVQKVLDGEEYISPNLADLSLKREQKIGEATILGEKITQLTNSELNVLKLIAQKKTTKEIAGHLFITPKSVENYRSRICRKLELDGKNNSLLVWTIEHHSLIEKLGY